MNKRKFLTIILDLIFPIVFNLVFFLLLKDNQEPSVWIAYAFIHLAYVLMISTPLLVPKSKNTHVFKETSFLISFIGFIAILFMGLIIILLKPSNYLFSLIPLIIIFSIEILIYVINMIGNIETAKIDQKKKEERDFINQLLTNLKLVNHNDKKINKLLNGLIDKIDHSPSRSDVSIFELENKILSSSKNLISANLDERQAEIVIQEIINMIDQRNNALSMLN